MAKDPAFLFYDGDAARDVSHMNRLERGCYFDLIQAQRKFGGFTVEQARKILGRDFDDCWGAIELILSNENGIYFIEWVKNSIEKRNQHSEIQRKRIQDYWDNKKNNKEYQGNTVVLPLENENENIIIDNNKGVIGEKEEGKKTVKIPFEKFWEAYDKKVDRKICEKKWNNLPSKDQVDILNYLPNYIRGTPDKQYRKDPTTFLNRRSWENEIITKPVTNEKHNAKSRDHSKFNQGYDPYAEIVQAKMGDLRH